MGCPFSSLSLPLCLCISWGGRQQTKKRRLMGCPFSSLSLLSCLCVSWGAFFLVYLCSCAFVVRGMPFFGRRFLSLGAQLPQLQIMGCLFSSLYLLLCLYISWGALFERRFVPLGAKPQELQIMGCPFLVCIFSCAFVFRGVPFLKGVSSPQGHSSSSY